MKRREFITLVGGVAAWPLAARAEQAGPLRRIGFLFTAIPPAHFGSDGGGRGFTQGMREIGYLEGKDFVVEWRSAEGHYERLPDFAAELVRMKVDVFVTGSSPAVRPAQQATTTIPIVMGYSLTSCATVSLPASRTLGAIRLDWQAPGTTLLLNSSNCLRL